MYRFSEDFESHTYSSTANHGDETTFMDSSVGSANSSASSSKAVLAALRALQEKIRRLEAEKTQALDECQTLRSQKKSLEVDMEHERQRELLTQQKANQESRIGIDKLMSEKTDLEHKLNVLEERKNTSQMKAEELVLKIQALEGEKNSAVLKLQELEATKGQIEKQFIVVQDREKQLTKTLAWETQKHSEEVEVIQEKLRTVEGELRRVKSERVGNDKRLTELDHLVGQLLTINEALVRQLGGDQGQRHKSRRASTAGFSRGSMLTKPTEASKLKQVPRKGTRPIATSKAGIKESMTNNIVENAQRLQELHDMYVNMSRTAVNGPSKPVSAGAGTRKKIVKRKAPSTRMSRRPPLPQTTPTERAYAILNERMNRLNLHIPNVTLNTSKSKPQRPSFDDSDIDSFQENRGNNNNMMFSDSLLESSSLPSNGMGENINLMTKSSSPARSLGGQSMTSMSTKNDLQSAISTLESEFDSLNDEYRKLLNEGSTTDFGSDGLVDIIQKMHAKGDELKSMKSPERVTKSASIVDSSPSSARSRTKTSPRKATVSASSPAASVAGSTHLSQLQASPSAHRAVYSQNEQQTHHPDVLSFDQIEIIKHKLLAASYTTYGPDINTLFHRIDQDGSGQIEKKELAAIVKKLLPDISSNQITHLMKTCDEDKSGKISYTEFIRFLGQRSSQTSHYAYAQDL